MAKSILSNAKYILILIIVIGGSWMMRDVFDDQEIITINGDAIRVIDGDSFKSANEEFRIRGIDAPEFLQTCNDENEKPWRCGHFAREVLQHKLAGQGFSCEVFAIDRFGRKIVNCSSSQTDDLGSWLVEQGAAISGKNFDETIYAVDEKRARNAKKGIWRGSFVKPSIWRAKHPRS